jgi:hypothetical protein
MSKREILRIKVLRMKSQIRLAWKRLSNGDFKCIKSVSALAQHYVQRKLKAFADS